MPFTYNKMYKTQGKIVRHKLETLKGVHFTV